MLDYLTKRPMLFSAILCVIVSILIYTNKWALLFIVPILIFLIWFFVFFKKNPRMVVCVITVTTVVLSSVFTLEKVERLSTLEGLTTEGEFVVVSQPVDRETVYTTELEVIKSDLVPKGVKIYTYFYNDSLKLGEKVNAKIKLVSTIGSPFERDNVANKIYLGGTVLNLEKTGESDLVLSSVDKVRVYIRSCLFENMKYDEAATMTAITFGDKDYFLDSFYKAAKYAGVAHVMVVSGMHLSIIILLFTKLMEKLFYNKYLRAITIVLAVVFLVALCGFTKSIIRAGFTYLLIAVSLFLGRKSTPENALGGAVSIIMIFSPFVIFSVSFMLSCLATFGILVVAIPIMRYVNEKEIIKSKIIAWIVTAVLVSLSALLMTLPVVIYYFGYISKVSVITNLLISTAVTFALSITVLALIINLFFKPLAIVMFDLAEAVTKYINFVIVKFGASEKVIIFLEENTVYIAVAIIVVILGLLLACKNKLDMVKLKKIDEKIVSEGGGRLKWRQ